MLDCEEDMVRIFGDESGVKAGKGQCGEIVFDHVTFSYNKNEPNLNDISFWVNKGEMLGVIGATGSGKTTLAALLMRLVDVDQGRILIQGQDIRSMEKKELQKKFGVVFQNDIIFEDSIFENVRM